MTVQEQSDRARSRVLRPTVLLLVVVIHAALLLVASRRVTRVDTRSEEPLIFLALPDHAQVPAPGTPTPAVPKKPVAPRDTQLVNIPAPAPPAADNPSAPIDWNAEAELAIKQYAELAMATPPRALDKHGAGADFNGGLGPDREKKAEFAWDRTHTRRIEPIEGGGMLIRLSDHCVFVVFPLPFVGCGIGKIPVHGDLFDHMHDEPQAGGNPKNIVP
jgi:type IV secretory pathway VirB10-like protein